MTDAEFVDEVLQVIFEADAHEDLWWRRGTNEMIDGKFVQIADNKLHFFINCNDVFDWGTADLEEITRENLALLRQSYEDDSIYGGLLFCARVRGRRPQGAYYKHFDEKQRELFNAAGPEREIDFFNPYDQDNSYEYAKIARDD